MKNITCAILVFFGTAAFCTAAAIAENPNRAIENAETSYAFGMLIAEDLVDSGLEFNYNSFMQGFRDTMEKAETRLTMNEAVEKIQAAFHRLEVLENEKRQKEAEHNMAESAAFLTENAKRSRIIVAPSGLQFESVTEGTGDMPTLNDTVLVHYRGTTIDGTVFDSTYEDGIPLDVPLNMVIPGWAEGLTMMKEGGRSIIYLPPELAYGERGAGPMIAPNSVLIFEVELLSIIRPEEEEDYDEEEPEDY